MYSTPQNDRGNNGTNRTWLYPINFISIGIAGVQSSLSFLFLEFGGIRTDVIGDA